ncbi:MAG: helix-turn-helix domain-containing protein, partial [Luteibacter sp.]
ERILRSADPIKIIAVDLGYESESAFSTAFKRTVGCSPRQYASRDSIGRRAGIDRSSDAVQ